MMRPESMSWIVRNLWLIPALPMAAAAVSALLKRSERRLSAGLAIGSMGISLVLSLMAFAEALADPARRVVTFNWIAVWRSVGAAGMAAGSAGRGDAGDGQLCGAADLHLQPRLHGARRQLHALLLLYVAVCGSNARGGDRETACCCCLCAGKWWG